MYSAKEYHIIHQTQQHYGNVYLEERQQISAFFQKNPKLLKTANYKVTNDMIKEVQSEFMISTETTNIGLIAISIYYKIRIILADEEKRAYTKFHPTEYEKTCILFVPPRKTTTRSPKRYKIRISTDETKDSEIIDQWFCKENYTTPLKSVGHYKITDLFEIAFKLGIENITGIKKNELYQKIRQYFV